MRFSLPVGTRSVGYLTKLLEPIFNEAQFEEHFLQWEHDINRYEKDNGAALPDGIKIALLLSKTKGALQQHLQLRAGQITDYNESAQTTMEELHQWTLTTFGGKEETTQAKEKAKATTKEVKAQASTGGKGHYENQFHNSARSATRRFLFPVYGIKYVPYKQDNFRIMMPQYVCDVTYPILSASRLLDRGYGLDFNPRHCTVTHGSQQAHLIRHSAEKADVPTGLHLPTTIDNGKPIAVQHNTRTNCATHTQTKRSLVEIQTAGNLMAATPSEFTNNHAKHCSHHTTAAAQYQKKNWMIGD